MLTNLKPYNPSLYTPSRKPFAIDDLVIILDHPRGYCAKVVSVSRFQITVQLLDNDEKLLNYPQRELIQTGKQAHTLIEQYELSAEAFDENLDTERGLPDFGKFKKKTSTKPRAKKEPKKLTEFQKKLIGDMLRERLKELKGV